MQLYHVVLTSNNILKRNYVVADCIFFVFTLLIVLVNSSFSSCLAHEQIKIHTRKLTNQIFELMFVLLKFQLCFHILFVYACLFGRNLCVPLNFHSK